MTDPYLPKSARWAPPVAPTLYVNATVGNNNNDGLTPGSGGAFATIPYAVSFIKNNLDAAAGPPTIQLEPGDHWAYGGVSITYAQVGSAQILIRGDDANPSSTRIVCDTGETCLSVREPGTVATITGIKFVAHGNYAKTLYASQGGVIDFGYCEFSGFPVGVHVAGDVGAYINCVGPYTISGSAETHVLANNGTYINYGSFNADIPSALQFTNFVSCSSNSIVASGGVAMTFSGAGVAGTLGRKYHAQLNGIIIRSGADFPGHIPGVALTGAWVL
jgi:hypothetical protein